MAPVVTTLLAVLALSGMSEAKPLLSPGRHAPPVVANALAGSRRSFHSMIARYYGTAHGLTRPSKLNEKRGQALPVGWDYFGCLDESYNQRLLQGFSFSGENQTPLLCATQCGKMGFAYAGTEYGDECYCGNDFIGSGGGISADSVCSVPCAGDPSETCGNAWFLSVYKFNSTGLPSCTDSSGLPGSISVPPLSPVGPPMTASATTSANATATAVVPPGFSLLPNGTLVGITGSVGISSLPTAITTKTTSPAASPTTVDPDHSEWFSLGCAVDSNDRILAGYVNNEMLSLTIDECLSTCEEKGYTFAGVEYGQECYCSSVLAYTPTYNAAGCNMACKGNASETCGGGYAIDLYELTSGSSETCTTSASVTTTLSAVGGVATTGSIGTTVAGGKPQPTTANAKPTTTAQTAPPSNTNVPSSSSDHRVWAHHMVGNTYPYGQSDWSTDCNLAGSYGIDGFALNMGSDWWQPDRIDDAYNAAQPGFKMFLSLDMTSLSCNSQADGNNLVNLVKRWANHPNQAMHNGKVLVSTFAGSDCTFGTGSSHGWQSSFVDVLKNNGVNIFFVPSIFSDISTFSSNTWMDGELNWNSGWPMSDVDISTTSDSQYMAALGSKEYMPAISPFFYTHFSPQTWNKNWLYRGDDWLYCERWEQVIALRGSVKMTEILTWNDYGESSYIGPIAGALPAGSEVWVDGFDHTGLNVLTKYYATAFKTGSYPAITEDTIIMWSRPHPHDATASNDGTGRPTGWDWTDDFLYAVVLATQSSTVTLTAGSNSQTWSVQAGLTKLKLPSASGSMSGTISRGGSTVATFSAGSNFDYTHSPSTYNYNYMVGSSS